MSPPDPATAGAAEPIARFRHDLLTPVNHILGFCALLLDDAEMLGPPERLAALRRLYDEGCRVLEAIEDVLPRNPGPDHSPDFSALADRLAIPADAIARGCDRLGSAQDDRDAPDRADFLDDLAKIRRASALLVEMARKGPAGLPAA
jgi:signal transduction histidine kinase